MAEESENELQPVGIPDLVELCRILNDAGVQYVVFGGMACLLQGHERMTKDVDLFIGDQPGNIEKALKALETWGQGFSRDLSVDDVRESVVVRIFDRFIVISPARCGNWNGPTPSSVGAYSSCRVSTFQFSADAI